jgi:pimeloyl-ACP methyl ester carboxylesterase
MIAYERVGDGPVVVIVGGAFNTRSSPASLVPHLSGRLTVVTYDRRGRGDSTDASAVEQPGGFALPDFTDQSAAIAREVADLQAVVEAVGGAAMLYGHSSGAALALETAAATPGIRRVAGYEPPYAQRAGDVSSAAGGSGSGDAADAGEHAARPDDTGAQIVSALRAGDRDAAARLFVAGVGLDADWLASQPWWPGMVAMAQTLPYEFALTDDGPPDRLADVDARVLLLAGGDSPDWARQAVRDAARGIPEVVVRTLPGQTHDVKDAVIAPVLLDFFTGP